VKANRLKIEATERSVPAVQRRNQALGGTTCRGCVVGTGRRSDCPPAASSGVLDKSDAASAGARPGRKNTARADGKRPRFLELPPGCNIVGVRKVIGRPVER
jgi:hypothetical protein